MKKIFLIFTLLFSLSINAQVDNIEQPKINGVFEISKINMVDNYYLINAYNNEGIRILIMERKPKRKTCKKYRKDQTIKKIIVGEKYDFSLDSVSYDIGFTETNKIVVGEKVIWERNKSDFMVYSTNNLEGLYYISK